MPLTGGLLHLVQWGGAWAGPRPPRLTLPITVLLYNGSLLCGFNFPIKGLRRKVNQPYCRTAGKEMQVTTTWQKFQSLNNRDNRRHVHMLQWLTLVLPGTGGVQLYVAFLVNRNCAHRFITEIIFIEQLQFYTCSKRYTFHIFTALTLRPTRSHTACDYSLLPSSSFSWGRPSQFLSTRTLKTCISRHILTVRPIIIVKCCSISIPYFFKNLFILILFRVASLFFLKLRFFSVCHFQFQL